MILASAPAAAGQARAVMTVSATVAPVCSVALQPSARDRAEIACSSGAEVSTMTAGRHDEQPLQEAEALLGAPVRRGGAVVFTAPPASDAPGAATTADPAEPTARYLTITY